LDVTLDLNKATHAPNNSPIYVSTKSSHPPCVIRSIPEGINKRLSEISSSEEIFNKAAPTYQKALDESGHKYKLHYTPSENKTKKSRKRNIIWYNPPSDLNVQTNLGKKFLQIIDKCFKDKHPLKKICNRNTIKLSYSCMPSVQKMIQRDNNEKSKQHTSADGSSGELGRKGCNGKKPDECPLKGQCLTKDIVYQAKVHSENTTETYIGLTATEFKTRYNNHKQSFKDEKIKEATELSKYIWTLKKQNKNYEIKWNIICKAKSYNNITKKCNLCIAEKFYIICKPNLATLNKRSELISKCRHKTKYFLENIT
jgi:hypothetical protein